MSTLSIDWPSRVTRRSLRVPSRRGLDLGDRQAADRARARRARRALRATRFVISSNAARALVVDPAPHLLAAKARPALRHGERLRVGEGHRAQVGLFHPPLGTTAARSRQRRISQSYGHVGCNLTGDDEARLIRLLTAFRRPPSNRGARAARLWQRATTKPQEPPRETRHGAITRTESDEMVASAACSTASPTM